MESDYWKAVKSADNVEAARLTGLRPELVRAADKDGKTGLHWAAMNGWAETVELLLASGADARLRDARFDARWAEEGGHDRLAQRLRSARSE